MYVDTVNDRYDRDPQFKSLVDLLEAYVHAAQFSPSELRDAATLASIHFELRSLSRVRHFSNGRCEKCGDSFTCPEHSRINIARSTHGDPPPIIIVEGQEYHIKRQSKALKAPADPHMYPDKLIDEL